MKLTYKRLKKLTEIDVPFDDLSPKWQRRLVQAWTGHGLLIQFRGRFGWAYLSKPLFRTGATYRVDPSELSRLFPEGDAPEKDAPKAEVLWVTPRLEVLWSALADDLIAGAVDEDGGVYAYSGKPIWDDYEGGWHNSPGARYICLGDKGSNTDLFTVSHRLVPEKSLTLRPGCKPEATQ